MIIPRRLFLIVSVLYTLFGRNVRMDEVERYVVVSIPPNIEKFYFDARTKSIMTRSLSESKISNESIRKGICDDIIDSNVFRRDQTYPYSKKSGGLLAQLLNRFDYPYEAVDVLFSLSDPTVNPGTDYRNFIELTFVCRARHDSRRKYYYISNEFDLKSDSDSNSCPGRFIFHKQTRRAPWGTVYGLAELPAKAFYSPNYDVENVYLQRRVNLKGFTGVTTRVWSPSRDPLCKLDDSEKERICLAVFSSEYFAQKSSYSDIEFNGFCQASHVSFQTGEHEDAAMFEEWLLSCYAIGPNAFYYALSQAYTPDQIFVHSVNRRTGFAFLDHLVTNVRLNWLPPNPSDKVFETDE